MRKQRGSKKLKNLSKCDTFHFPKNGHNSISVFAESAFAEYCHFPLLWSLFTLFLNLGKPLWLPWWVECHGNIAAVWLTKLGFQRWNSFLISLSLWGILSLGPNHHVVICPGPMKRLHGGFLANSANLGLDEQLASIARHEKASFQMILDSRCWVAFILPVFQLRTLTLEQKQIAP